MQLFCKSIKKESHSKESKRGKKSYTKQPPETLDLVPDFVVAYNEEAMRAQHSTFHFVGKTVRRSELDKTIDLTNNLKFSYKTARNSYFVSDGSGTETKVPGWENLATGNTNWYVFQRIQTDNASKQIQHQLASKPVEFRHENRFPPPLKWTFHAEKVFQVNRVLFFVNSNEFVKWTAEVRVPGMTESICFELTSGLEKIEELCKPVQSIVLTAQVPREFCDEDVLIFKENRFKNHVSMVVAVNESAEAFLTTDLLRPSEQNLSKAILIRPSSSGIFEFNYLRIRPVIVGEAKNNVENQSYDCHQIMRENAGTGEVFIENWNDFEFGVETIANTSMVQHYCAPTKTATLKKHVTLSWRFENFYNLPITDVSIYVNSMANYDHDALRWKLQSNTYECVLNDKQNNVVKLPIVDRENLHEEIILKLEMNPKKIKKFFITTESAPQVRMKLKFDTRADVLREYRAKGVKWTPKLIGRKRPDQKPTDFLGRAKSQVEAAVSKVKSNFTQTLESPPCCLIIAIDETKMFSQSGKGSIQPKLRRAVNDLVINLLKRLKYRNSDEEMDNTEETEKEFKTPRYREDVGIVVVRFGGTDYEYKPDSDFSDVHAGPFKKQKIGQFAKCGTSIYEFVPKSNAEIKEHLTDDTRLDFFQTFDMYGYSNCLKNFDLFVSFLFLSIEASLKSFFSVTSNMT